VPATVAAAALTLTLGALVITALFLAWRKPELGLPLLIAGIAVHNAAIMLLLTAHVPDLMVRCIQLWKEALLVLLGLKLVVELARSGLRSSLSGVGSSWRSTSLVVRLLDSGMALFAIMLVVYTVVPIAARDSQASLTQRLLELRVLELLPLLYLFGRVWPPVSLRFGLGIVIGVAALVVVLGMFELFFIPTRSWFDMGILRFESWLGYSYPGPQGLPENFFQGTSAGLLRRMVSTYISPLGIAYTGLLVIPAAFVVAASPGQRKRYAWLAFALVLVGMSFSLTRLALLLIVAEAILLAFLRLRRPGMLAAGAIVAATVFGLLVYPSFGPVVSIDLADVRPPIGQQMLSTVSQHVGGGGGGGGGGGSGGQQVNTTTDVVTGLASGLTSGDDTSIQAHADSVVKGFRFVAEHPLGVGLGTAVPRYGAASSPGESAFFEVGADIGLLGLLLFSALYGGLVLAGLAIAWRRREDVATCALGAIVGVGGLALFPIVLTSQVWSDFSVTFLFWWTAGSVVTAVARNRTLPSRAEV
jgi:hypothetical protein